MYKIIFTSFLFLTLFNCTSRQPAKINEEIAVEGDAALPYVMNLENIHKDKGVLHLSDIAENVLYIPLETTDEVLLRRVVHVAILDNTLDNQMIYIQLTWGLHGDPLYSVYNKTTKELIGLGSDGIMNDLDGGSFFFPDYTENDGLKIAWKDAADFKENILSLDHTLQKSKYGDKFEALHHLATSINEDDNPIVIIAK